jgi:hypothetical protein
MFFSPSRAHLLPVADSLVFSRRAPAIRRSMCWPALPFGSAAAHKATFGKAHQGGLLRRLFDRSAKVGRLVTVSWGLVLRAAVLRLAVRVVGAAGYGSSELSLRREAVAMGSSRSRAYRPGSSEARHRATPNPSIERTSPGKPGLASHVKR